MSKFTPETGKKAGSISKRGPDPKKEAWNRLGTAMITKHSGRVNEYLTKLYHSDPEKFFNSYVKILPYFKPTIQAHAIKQETEITVRVISEDQDLMEKI